MTRFVYVWKNFVVDCKSLPQETVSNAKKWLTAECVGRIQRDPEGEAWLKHRIWEKATPDMETHVDMG